MYHAGDAINGGSNSRRQRSATGTTKKSVFNLSVSAINEMSTKQLKQAFKTVGEVQQKQNAGSREDQDDLKARLVLYVSGNGRGNGTGNTSDGTSDNASGNSSDSEFSDYPSSSSDEEEEDTSGGSGGSDGHERYATGDKEGTCKKSCEKCRRLRGSDGHERYATGDKEGTCKKRCEKCRRRNLRGVDEEDLWTDGNGASDEYIDNMSRPLRNKALRKIKAQRTGVNWWGGAKEERRLLKQYGTNNTSSEVDEEEEDDELSSTTEDTPDDDDEEEYFECGAKGCAFTAGTYDEVHQHEKLCTKDKMNAKVNADMNLWTNGNGASDEYIDNMSQPSRRKALSMIKAQRTGKNNWGGKEEERRLLKQYGTNNMSSGKKRKRKSTSSSKKNSSKKKNKTT
jgi:hypothetical protein